MGVDFEGGRHPPAGREARRSILPRSGKAGMIKSGSSDTTRLGTSRPVPGRPGAPRAGDDTAMGVTSRARRAVPRLGWAAALALVLGGAAAALGLKAPWDPPRPRMLLPNRA